MALSRSGLVSEIRKRGENTPFLRNWGRTVTNIMSTTIFDGVYWVVLTRAVESYFLTDESRYSTEPFASANGQIPQLNIWDDHDVRIPWAVCQPGYNEFPTNSLTYAFRSLMVSAHMLTSSCAVQSFEALEALQTSIIYSFSITSHHPSLHSRLVSLLSSHMCNF